MRATSIHWDEEFGMCTLHGLPEVPCPQCMAEAHPDVVFLMGGIDRSVLEFSSLDPEGPQTVDDLLPDGFSTETHQVI